MSIGPSITEVVEEFRLAMAEHNISHSGDISADGKLNRFHVDGDAAGSKNGWYILHFDESPAGQFGCNKRYADEKFPWSSKKKISFTPEQKKEYAQRREQQRIEKEQAIQASRSSAADRAQSIWDASTSAVDHPYLEAKGVKSYGLRVGQWDIVDRTTGEVRPISSQALLVPICDRTRNIRSLQAIFPSKIMGGRDKDYLRDGEKRGMFYAIGKPQVHEGARVFVIAEGYSTAASIHEATGHCVLVTFDTSNLAPVAQSIRERQPDAIIIFAADNDLGVSSPVKNPGVHYANQAAQEVAGIVAVPPFDLDDGEYDTEGKWRGPTDFNDLHKLRGLESVTVAFTEALNNPEPPAASEEPALPWESGSTPATEHNAADIPPEASKPAMQSDGDYDDDELVKNSGFTILGYDQSEYFVFHHGKQQVMALRKGDITDVGLIELQEPFFWESYFPAKGGGIDRKSVANWLFTTAHSRGIYDPTRIRGRGAWIDKGRAVFHHGSHLTVDGDPVAITQMKSGYVYPLGRSMPAIIEPMSDEEGQQLVDIAKMVRWSMPASAALMSGWAMLAPICGALSWRPHIWLLGAAGSGKTAVQSKYLGPLLRDIGMYAQGDSTEPGIRQELRADALPVMIDEIESNNDGDKKRTESIIGMVRKTSSESWAKTFKGSASGDSMSFQIRSMFCLASINANLPTKADIDRLTRLNIRPPSKDKKDNAAWMILEGELNRLNEDSEVSSRLLSRALNMLPVIRLNIERFRKICAGHFGTQRDGDQYGTLLAGCWSLMHSRPACDYDVLEMLGKYDFHEHTEDNDQDDAARALEAILSSKIRVLGGADFSVYELIRESTTTHRAGVLEEKIARQTLNRHGIRVEQSINEIWFGTASSTLQKLVDDKPFVTDLRGQLLRVAGADRVEGPKKMNGTAMRCISVPLLPILTDNEDQDDLPI